MTREAAIKALERAEDYAGIQCVNSCVDAYISPYLLKAIDFAVAALREQEERRWIPVTERLPKPKHEIDERNWYLVALSNGVVKELAYEFHKHSIFGYGWRETAYPVTHWMPMPKPPKGE